MFVVPQTGAYATDMEENPEHLIYPHLLSRAQIELAAWALEHTGVNDELAGFYRLMMLLGDLKRGDDDEGGLAILSKGEGGFEDMGSVLNALLLFAEDEKVSSENRERAHELRETIFRRFGG